MLKISPADAASTHDATDLSGPAPGTDPPATPLRCPICQAPCPAADASNLSLCRHCQHIFQGDLRVSTAYDAAYIHHYDELPCEAMSDLRWRFIQHALALPAGSRILDVGYGNGAFLKHARAHGMSVFGLDVHGQDFGIPVIGYDSDLAFDLVCFFDSLEHLPRFDCLFGLRTRHVMVSLPHTPPDLLRAPQRWRHYKPGEHLHYFSPHSLDALMRRWGLCRIASGFPEDALRGRLRIDNRAHDNIYSALFSRC